MRERILISEKLFLAVSSLATLFVLTEIVMQSYGTSICFTEGCKIVSRQVRFGDLSMLLIGLFTFASLAWFSAQSLYRGRTVFERYLNVILVASLAAEGFFAGYQAFSVHKACLFCLIIFSLIVLLGILRLLSGVIEMWAGFAALAVVFSLPYLVMPVSTAVILPKDDRLILFYSKDCRHCTEIMKELDEKKIAVTHLQAIEHADFLNSMGIESVPTLYVNDPYQKVILTGAEAIRRYLLACAATTKAAEGSVQNTKSGKTAKSRKTSEAGATLDFFSQQGILHQNNGPVPDDGICKEDEICK